MTIESLVRRHELSEHFLEYWCSFVHNYVNNNSVSKSEHNSKYET